MLRRGAEEFRAANKVPTTRGTATRIRALPLASREGARNRESFGKEFVRSGYSNFRWLIRVVPVIAGVALLGGMIGGFAMFAIDSALTWEPPPQSRLDVRADNQTTTAANEARANRRWPCSGSLGRNVGTAAAAAAISAGQRNCRSIRGADFTYAADSEAAWAGITAAATNRNDRSKLNDAAANPERQSTVRSGAKRCTKCERRSTAAAADALAGCAVARASECRQCAATNRTSRAAGGYCADRRSRRQH